MERTKGWNVDEIWYGKNLTPLEDSWAYQGEAVKSKFHKPNGWKARRSAGY